jgi:hypothetical protein
LDALALAIEGLASEKRGTILMQHETENSNAFGNYGSLIYEVNAICPKTVACPLWLKTRDAKLD